MSYAYEELRPHLFTEEGSVQFTVIRDAAKRLLQAAGAFSSGSVFREASGDTWLMLACLDRMVELGELREVTTDVAGQDQVFVEGPRA